MLIFGVKNMDDIKCLKLVSGEDVLAKVKVHENEYELDNPVQLMLAPQGQLGFIPFMPFAAEGEKIKVNKKHVMLCVEPLHEIKNEYNSRFGSGIVVPDTSLRLT